MLVGYMRAVIRDRLRHRLPVPKRIGCPYRLAAWQEGRTGMMRIVERKVSAGGRDIFDLDEFLSRPLYAHLAHDSGHGPRNSPVWFHWDGQALWIIGGTSFPKNLRREPRCAIGIVDWDPASGLSQHAGLRGRAEVLAFDPAVARTILGYRPDCCENML